MAAVVAGFIIRIILSCFFVSIRNHDTIGWETIGSLTLRGVNIYPSQAHEFHAFFPVFLYINALGMLLQKYGIPTLLVIKLICSVFDTLNIYLVYLLSYKQSRRAWVYAINPVAILVTCVHGQFESIPIFFLLLSMYVLKRKRIMLSGIFASAAIAFKTWPLMFLIPAFKRVKNIRYLLLFGVIPLLAIAVYIYFFRSSIGNILHETLLYRGQPGNYGAGYIISHITYYQANFKLFSNLFLVMFVLFSLLNTRRIMLDEILDQMIFFFLFSPTFGLQWLGWIVPFMVIRNPKYSLVFLTATSLYVLIPNYYWFSQNEKIMEYLDLLGVISWFSLLLVGMGRLLEVARLNSIHNRNKNNKHKNDK